MTDVTDTIEQTEPIARERKKRSISTKIQEWLAVEGIPEEVYVKILARIREKKAIKANKAVEEEAETEESEIDPEPLENKFEAEPIESNDPFEADLEVVE